LTISVRLYGKFSDLGENMDEPSRSIGLLDIEEERAATAGDLIAELELQEKEVSHVFVNGKYSSFNKAIESGDEVALFPADMGLLYHWYFEEED